MQSDDPQFLCQHVAEGITDIFVWFTWIGKELNWTCGVCAKNYPNAQAPWLPATEEWLSKNRDEIYWEGIVGKPEVKHRATNLSFSSRDLVLQGDGDTFVDARPCRGRPFCWHALSTRGVLVLFSSADSKIITSCQLEHLGFEITAETGICISPHNDFAVVSQASGPNAVLVDVQKGNIIRRLSRGDYHCQNTHFPVAFFLHEGRTYLIAASDWNRLDLHDPINGKVLSERGPTTYEKGDQKPHRYLDYFHGGLSVSPDHQVVVDNGWCWSPIGVLRTWNLPAWLSNVWESEDGPTSKELTWKDGWDQPVCWVDNNTLVTWGWGKDEWAIPAAVLIDVRNGEELRWFPGPEVKLTACWPPRMLAESLFFDKYLFAVSDDEGTTAWNIETGECLLTDRAVKPWRYHSESKEFLEITPTGFRLSTLVE